MTTETEIYTLHRYFIWANKMRTDFYAILGKRGPGKPVAPKEQIDLFLYMSLWYSQIYVVIESWREIGLIDKSIDSLLTSPNVDLLRRYRNGVCHFQKDYYDERFQGFMKDGEDSVQWVRYLNSEFGRWFFEHFKNNKNA